MEATPKPFVRLDHLPLAMQDPKPSPRRQRSKRKRRPSRQRLPERDWRGLWIGRIWKLASRPRRRRLRCLALLRGCASEWLALRGRLPLTLKYPTEIIQSRPAQMKRPKRVRRKLTWTPQIEPNLPELTLNAHFRGLSFMSCLRSNSKVSCRRCV